MTFEKVSRPQISPPATNVSLLVEMGRNSDSAVDRAVCGIIVPGKSVGGLLVSYEEFEMVPIA